MLYISFTFAVNTSAISFAIFAEFTGSFVVTVIFIISVSFTALTVTLFFNSSSLIVVPKFKFVITCLITFLLFTSSLYVDTHVEFTVMSVAVDVVIVFEFD